MYWCRSESFGPDNLFYAFNLGGLVTYILSSHIFEASLLWMDTVPFIIRCLSILVQIIILVMRLHLAKT